MQMLADMKGVGVKNRKKYADVLCGRPLYLLISMDYLPNIFAKRGKAVDRIT